MKATGETDLKTLLKTMQPVLHEGVYVFHSSDISFAQAANLDPVLIFREQEGVTLILEKNKATRAGLSYHYSARMITLNVHSALEAVGFLATITEKLAASNISVNPVSAYYHDHIFIPADQAEKTMKILRELRNQPKT